MGGGKETPRQKMVGLMYLVLMALLAMNVSKEIINAFVTLNNKLESSIEQVESFNTGLSDEFATKLATLKSHWSSTWMNLLESKCIKIPMILLLI